MYNTVAIKIQVKFNHNFCNEFIYIYIFGMTNNYYKYYYNSSEKGSTVTLTIESYNG